MRTRRGMLGALLGSLIALALSATPAAADRHSGVITAIDLDTGTIVIEEVGPWQVKDGQTQVTPRTFTLTATTRCNLFMRLNEGTPSGYPGDFIEVELEPTDFTVGDYVTVDCRKQGNRLIALTVTLAEASAP